MIHPHTNRGSRESLIIFRDPLAFVSAMWYNVRRFKGEKGFSNKTQQKAKTKKDKTMNSTGYKSVDELTKDQFEELRQMMIMDVETREGFTAPDSWYDDIGDFTDAAVREFYEGTGFVDDDFSCTAHGATEEVQEGAA